MANKILTVGIPTFNGSKYIKEAIESIVTQVGKNSDLVEILVSDNASTDGTAIIVNEYIKNKSNVEISYICNSINVGYDRNVDNLFKHAKGEFVWLLGDDDYLADGAITKFFEVISKHKNLSIVLLAVQFLDIVTGKTNQMVKFDNDYFCRDGDEFFEKCEWGAAALSSLIIRKIDWNSQSLSNYFGNQWIHIAGIVRILSKQKFTYIVSNVMVIVRVSNNRWERNGNQLMLAFSALDILSEMNSLGYKVQTYQFFAKDRFKRTLFEIIHLRPQSFNARYLLAKRMMQYHKSYFAFWFLHLPILFMPNSLLTLLRNARRVLLNIKAKSD